jgi:beta-glucosidase
MKTKLYAFIMLMQFISFTLLKSQNMNELVPFKPIISFEDAGIRADELLKKMTIDEKIELVGGHNLFFIKGFDKFNIPQLYLSDATQGVHIRSELSNLMEKSTAFPCPLALTATWNTELAYKYSKSIGEECRVSDVAVLLGPGMNIYRISQNGRNFEYFGEDPYLAARMVEKYVVGMQSTGTMATLKHFLCNNTDNRRRRSNSIVDERTLYEIYLPAFKAGIDAGAMAVMTSYNQVNGEWAGQSEWVINQLLRKELGFKWLVMTDWWSTYDPLKEIKSGQDLDMPGHAIDKIEQLKEVGDVYVRSNAKRLLNEGKITENDITRMAKSIMRTCIAMGIYDRPVKDLTLKAKFQEHENIALQTAREAIVLLKNKDNILPLNKSTNKTILLTGNYVEKIARGGGSAEVEGYNNVSMLSALTAEFGQNIIYEKNPSNDQIESASVVLISVGTDDSEGWDKPFELPAEMNNRIINASNLNSKVIVILSAGGGRQMTQWNDKVAGIIYTWYSGQNGNTALAEIISGKTNPSGKLPITIEKKFEDSPGFSYLPLNQKLDTNWDQDMNHKVPMNNIEYKEGVFVGYRWYESKNIEPLYPFGFGLSYTSFAYENLKISASSIAKNEPLTVEFTLKNTGTIAGAEVAQLYVHDIQSSVIRPVKELKGFSKVFLNAGESKTIKLTLNEKDFAFWDVNQKKWNAESGEFEILIGSASNNIKLKTNVSIK